MHLARCGATDDVDDTSSERGSGCVQDRLTRTVATRYNRASDYRPIPRAPRLALVVVVVAARESELDHDQLARSPLELARLVCSSRPLSPRWKQSSCRATRAASPPPTAPSTSSSQVRTQPLSSLGAHQ